MEYDEEEEEWKDAEQMEIFDIAQNSLNAVAGVSDYTSMRVKGLPGKKNFYVLIDSESTHNFMDKMIAK